MLSEILTPSLTQRTMLLIPQTATWVPLMKLSRPKTLFKSRDAKRIELPGNKKRRKRPKPNSNMIMRRNKRLWLSKKLRVMLNWRSNLIMITLLRPRLKSKLELNLMPSWKKKSMLRRKLRLDCKKNKKLKREQNKNCKSSSRPKTMLLSSAKLTKKPNSKQRLVLRLKRSSRRRPKHNLPRKKRRKRLSSKPLVPRLKKMLKIRRSPSRRCRLKPRLKVRKMPPCSKQNWFKNNKKWKRRRKRWRAKWNCCSKRPTKRSRRKNKLLSTSRTVLRIRKKLPTPWRMSPPNRSLRLLRRPKLPRRSLLKRIQSLSLNTRNKSFWSNNLWKTSSTESSNLRIKFQRRLLSKMINISNLLPKLQSRSNRLVLLSHQKLQQ